MYIFMYIYVYIYIFMYIHMYIYVYNIYICIRIHCTYISCPRLKSFLGYC